MEKLPDNTGATPAPPGPDFTAAQFVHLQDAFDAVLRAAVLPYKLGQLELFEAEHEQYIRREVERKLWQPRLPNGGDRERVILERLKKLKAESRKRKAEGESGPMDWRIGRALDAWQSVLPQDPSHAGRYYRRQPLTARLDKHLYEACLELAREGKGDRKWFAQMLLDGLPEEVSNFEMECLFLLRKSDGSVERLVRLRNILGEVSRGPHHDGADLLPAKAFAAPERFREWALERGNFAWSGNQRDLHALQEDDTHSGAWRVMNRVDSVGWLAVKRALGRENPNSKLQTPEKLQGSNLKTESGIWFFNECAYAEGKVLWPDEKGVYTWNEEGYYLNRKGRETNFSQGRPSMRPERSVMQELNHGWTQIDTDGKTEIENSKLQTPNSRETEKQKAEMLKAETLKEPELMTSAEREEEELTLLREFYRSVCRRFYNTLGGAEGWMGMGVILSYSAAPEIFERYGLFPGLFVHGQMGSGKTKVVEWLMHCRGFTMNGGHPLSSKSTTAVGLLCDTENYSNEPVWVDEFNPGRVHEDKLAVLQDAYNRQPPVKWIQEGGEQRTMKTSFIVSGTATSSDAAMRSRFPHMQVSKAKRLVAHLDSMDRDKDKFYLLTRFTLEQRAEFAVKLMEYLEDWVKSPAMSGVNERERIVHGIGWASWMAMCALLMSHDAAEVKEFRTFMVEHTRASAADVTSDTNINVFLMDFLTAWNAGEIPEYCVRVESVRVDHPPGNPNQNGGWTSDQLYLDPEGSLMNLQIFLRKANATVTLSRKDLRDQLSRTEFWIPGSHLKRFGHGTDTHVSRAWGFELDKMDLGRQTISDEDFEAYQRTSIEEKEVDGDPRHGPFYAIVNAVKRKARERAMAAK